METRKPTVLLIGESVQGSSLLTRLDKRGCEYSFATSCHEAFQILRKREFDLVFGPTRLRDGNLYPIMSLLEGSDTTVFYFYAVEHGSWWLPALQRGRKCFGSPALRSSEFVILLDETIERIQRESLAPATSQPLLVLRAHSSVVPVSPQSAELKRGTQAPNQRPEGAKRKAAG
jgi:hypothetical protein